MTLRIGDSYDAPENWIDVEHEGGKQVALDAVRAFVAEHGQYAGLFGVLVLRDNDRVFLDNLAEVVASQTNAQAGTSTWEPVVHDVLVGAMLAAGLLVKRGGAL